MIQIPTAHWGAFPLIVAANTPSPLLWYVTRTAAVVGYVLLTFTVIIGMVRSIGPTAPEKSDWLIDEIHQFSAIMAAALIGLHLLALIFDPYLPFALVSVLLPINEPYRFWQVDLGIVGFYALLVVYGTSWLRRYMAYHTWRQVHYASFGAFALVTLHGFFAGSDANEAWMRAIYGAALAAVGYLGGMHLLARTPRAKEIPQYAPRAVFYDEEEEGYD